MYHSRISLLIAFIIGAVQLLNAQNFTTQKELKKYYKENSNKLPSPQEGWHKVWIIMPSESGFLSDFKDEVVNAKVFVKDGEVHKVFYEDYQYAQTVYAHCSVKKGKAVFKKVIFNVNNNLTEVFTAYNHTVIFKEESNEKSVPLEAVEKAGKMTFFSSEKKVEKQGFFVFVKNEKTQRYDFVGYLNKKCSEVQECNEDNGLHFYIKSGNYEMLAVQNKIQFNRHMPINTYDVLIEDHEQRTQEIIAKK
ncbi:hypothetical protein [Flammeovirga sp. EKP202]|uniref:hypothetical protein n=1 Tax=Flammeovirga sp. EKP202 TaxID=2770592 RepID=UPI00165F1AFD|nr:hypothetical protein [Flammeovirga sp. EKP202]MBD0405155.1 hypothetical protein [Flammeovirga sp. EKP202]